jgi:hypothetical protein
MQRIIPTTLITLAVFMAAPLIAAAQDAPKVEVSGGYQLLYLWGEDGEDDNSETFEKGWYADVSARVTRSVALVFQAGGNYKTMRERLALEGVEIDANLKLKLHQIAGGVRFYAPTANGVVTPFVQVLGGGFRLAGDSSATIVIDGEETTMTDEGDSETEPMLQAGGGIDIRLTRRIGIRVGADYLRVFTDAFGEEIGINGIRVGAGAVIGF